MAINIIFFILPFLLYLGIALQGAAFYLICIFIPAIYFIFHKKEIPNFITKIAYCLIAIHIIFPITSIINYFSSSTEFPLFNYHIELKWPGILQSNFPSVFFIGSLIIILFANYSKKHSLSTSSKKLSKYEVMPLKYFLSGLLPASILICLTLIYQNNTGIELRSLRGGLLNATEILDNGKYRVYGFYGHPLTVAGVGLAYVSFAWSLLWQYIANKNKVTFDFIFLNQKKYFPQVSLTIITFCNFIMIILSSGRTAAVAAMLILVIIPFLLYFRKKPFLTLITVSLILVSSFFIGKQYGLLERIEFTTTSITKEHSLDVGNYRQYFWKVHLQMFLDKPIIGQGNYWLKAGIRDNYYEKLGYAELPEKFNAHNNYLETLASGGLLAAAWIITFLIIIAKTLRKKLYEQKGGYIFLPFCLAMMIISNLIHSFTQNVFFDSTVIYIYITFLYVIMWQISANKKIKT